MDSSRLRILSLFLFLFVFVSAFFVWRWVNFSRSHYRVGNVPPEIANQLLPKDIPLSAMHPPAIRPVDPIRYGNATSIVSVIEFGDYQCEFCRDMHAVLEEVLPRYRGRVRFVWRDFPIEEKHTQAIPAAIFARCSGLLGDYWAAHDRLMQSDSLNEGAYRDIATKLKLDRTQLEACRKDPGMESFIRRDRQEAQADGVKSAPLLFVGTQAFDHALSVETLTQAIDQALSSL